MHFGLVGLKEEFLLTEMTLIQKTFKKVPKFNLTKFAALIAKNSKTQVIIVKNQMELSKFLKRNLISNEIIIGMGAGAISRWMSELKNTL